MCDLLLDADKRPYGESSTIKVSSGKNPNRDMDFQYISGWGLEFLTSSF